MSQKKNNVQLKKKQKKQKKEEGIVQEKNGRVNVPGKGKENWLKVRSY